MVETLSAIELRIMRLLSEGALNKNIASELNLSVRTVENYRKRIMTKTGATTACNLGYRIAQLEEGNQGASFGERSRA